MAKAKAKAKLPTARGADKLAAMRATLPTRAAVNRNAELEALIADDPEDPSRYLVYADWLQAREDARGTLIALHDAHRRNHDKATLDLATALVDEHRYTLLEQLDGRKDVDVEWYLGFIKSARIRAPIGDQVIEALTALLDAHSSEFLQALVIDHLERGSDREIVKLLVERGRPQTLAYISIGKPGAWAPPPELVDAFPRLRRDAEVAWTSAMAKVAEQRKLKIEIDATTLPELVAKTGELDVDPAAVLVGLKAELDKKRPIGILAAMSTAFTRDSLDAFALALAEQWQELDQTAVKWAFDAIGPLGGDRCIEFLGERLGEWSHQRAMQGVEHLRRIGTTTALREIVNLVSRLTRFRPRRDEARAILAELADSRGLPTVLHLIAHLPPPHGDDRVILTERWWLYELMVAGTRLAPADFTTYVTGNTVRRPLAATLLWGEFLGPELVTLFAVGRDGQPRGADGNPHELVAAHHIGVVHPVELTPAEVDTWLDVFEHRAITQTILQLGRPVFTLTHEEARGTSLSRFQRWRVGFDQLQSALEERDWYTYEQYDQGGTESYGRDFARDGVTVIAHVGSGSIDTVNVRGADRYEVRTFDSLHAVTVSELLYDLEIAHRRIEPLSTTAIRQAPPPPPPAAKPAGPAPIIEKAKTGRAKCVVCQLAIVKDSTRIGIERMIETPTFRGMGTVWLHPACRTGVPELEGVELPIE